MTNLFTIFVELNEGTKDYVTGYLYKNGKLVQELDEINKPWDVEDYTLSWKNGLWDEYKRRATIQGLVAETDYVNYI